MTVRLIVVVWLSEPDRPVIVTVLVPVNAELLTASVRVLDPVAGFALHEDVTPLPCPVTENVTELENPLVGLTVIVDVPCDPRVMVKLVGDAESEKFAGAVTLSVTETVCAMLFPVPVTVIVYVPTAVLAPTFMVMVALPDPGAAREVGLKLTDTPDGWPFAVNETAELKPPEMADEIVDVPLPPCTTEIELGEAVIEKSPLAVTVKLTVAVCEELLPVPVTVIG